MVSPTGEITLDANIDRSDNGDVCIPLFSSLVKIVCFFDLMRYSSFQAKCSLL